VFCTKNKVALLVLIALLALSNVSAIAIAGTTPPINTSYEQKVVELVNVERQKYGLPALYYDSAISDVARTKSADMAVNNYFSHYSPTYGMASDMLLSFGITWTAWGENIASGQDTPEEVVSQWMNSPSHRDNILSPNFVFIGVGYYVDSSGTPYWTQMFTNDFK
jgi:uncharacterized YkwD family protein